MQMMAPGHKIPNFFSSIRLDKIKDKNKNKYNRWLRVLRHVYEIVAWPDVFFSRKDERKKLRKKP